MRIVADDWQARRALLNHDVLLNKVLNSFRAAATIASGQFAIVEQFLQLFLDRKAEFGLLLEQAPQVLSPAQWLDRGPLGSMPSESRDRLRTFLEQDFLATSWVPSRVLEGKAKLEEALAASTDLLKSGNAASVAKIQNTERCLQDLSVIISSLPRDSASSIATMFEPIR